MQLSGSQGLPEPRPSDLQAAAGGTAGSVGATAAAGGAGAASRALAGAGAASPGVGLLQVDSADSLALETGTVVQARVLEREGDDVTLQVGGSIVRASTPLPLAEGALVDLAVRGQKGGQWLLQVLSARLYTPMTERDLARALKDMGMPVTDGNLQLARTMIEFGLPLTRGDMQQLLKLLGRLPGGGPMPSEQASAACFLKAGQLPVTSQNVLALATHLSRRPVLGLQLLNLQRACRRFMDSGEGTRLPTALAAKVAEMPRSLGRLVPRMDGPAPCLEPRDLARLAFEAGIEPHLPREPAAPGSRGWLTSLLQGLEALAPPEGFPTDVTRLQAALRQLAEQPGSQEHFVALQVALRRLVEADLPPALVQILSTMPGMERLESVAWLRALSRQLAAHPAQDAELLELRAALETLTRALADQRLPPTAPLRQAWQRMGDSPVLARLPRSLSDGVAKLDSLLAELEHGGLEGDSQRMRQVLLSLAGLQASIGGEEAEADAGDTVVLLRTLSRQLATAAADSPEGVDLRAALDDLAEGFVALRLLNAAVTAQGAWFLPIPLGLGGRTAQARLTCREDRHGKPALNADDLLFEIVIPTENLGNVCWRVRLKSGDLTLEGFLAEEGWRSHVERALPALTESLQEAGYLVQEVSCHVRETTPADAEPRMLAPRKLETRTRINLRI